LAEVFKTRTREQWSAALEGTDVCFSPVLSMGEAPEHPHHRARGTFVEIDGVVQPAPAPRFSRTQPGTPRPPPDRGHDGDGALIDWGFTREEIAKLRDGKS
jgi:alpha-methylacyl-CoA racemase